MPETLEDSEAPGSADPRDRSLLSDARDLANSARTLAEAEFAYQKARAAYAAGETRSIAILGVSAAVLAFFAVMALTFGLVLGLSTIVGPWWATAIVVGALLVIAFSLLLTLKSRSNRMIANLADTPKEST